MCTISTSLIPAPLRCRRRIARYLHDFSHMHIPGQEMYEFRNMYDVHEMGTRYAPDVHDLNKREINLYTIPKWYCNIRARFQPRA
ncbi:hypothetical protein Y032_0150g2740 [Ancylostoma ceylanicum]|uniref:Uncharacterized protein n=1 Tax=Ancylostoma ceylanicum TaxID=53326 RepID=A0A016T111_9BILA|nr:hypothetical protein Y032_0150g2740 [Ancylostoma ceylanicum]